MIKVKTENSVIKPLSVAVTDTCKNNGCNCVICPLGYSGKCIPSYLCINVMRDIISDRITNNIAEICKIMHWSLVEEKE